MINKIKKIFLSTLNSLKNFIIKNKYKINWHSIKKNKKKWVIGLFMLGYIFFWLWYFGEKDIALKEQGDSSVETGQIVSGKEDSKLKNKKESKQGFAEDDLKNFWLEIDTDKLKVKAPIVQGVDPADLKNGLGRHRTTSLPNKKGNMVISGHRWKFGDNPAYKVFEDLDKLKDGDKVSVHYGGRIFEYEIFEDGTVSDNEDGFDEVMKKTDDKMLTLYTCTPKYTALKRLYYRAKFIREY
jgi:sortase A